MLELMEDVIGINGAGQTCHPYKYKHGPKKGQFAYTFDPEEKVLQWASEETLRVLIENGQFNGEGGIYMVPLGSKNQDRRRVLNVLRYKGELLPVRSMPVLENC